MQDTHGRRGWRVPIPVESARTVHRVRDSGRAMIRPHRVPTRGRGRFTTSPWLRKQRGQPQEDGYHWTNQEAQEEAEADRLSRRLRQPPDRTTILGPVPQRDDLPMRATPPAQGQPTSNSA